MRPRNRDSGRPPSQARRLESQIVPFVLSDTLALCPWGGKVKDPPSCGFLPATSPSECPGEVCLSVPPSLNRLRASFAKPGLDVSRLPGPDSCACGGGQAPKLRSGSRTRGPAWHRQCPGAWCPASWLPWLSVPGGPQCPGRSAPTRTGFQQSPLGGHEGCGRKKTASALKKLTLEQGGQSSKAE